MLYTNGKEAVDICEMYNISIRTFRRWTSAYKTSGIRGLQLKKPGPDGSTSSISRNLEQKIVRLKQKHPSWGARRIKYQYDISCHWRTVHRVIKRRQMLVRIKPKPQPSRRFQRSHVDSMWQGDTFHFRISGTGRVYVTGFTDDRSRFRVVSGAYLHRSRKESIDALREAVKKGRIPSEAYFDNGKQFTARVQGRACKIQHKANLWQTVQSKRQGQDRELSQGALPGADKPDKVLVTCAFQKRAEKVRPEVQLLEEKPDAWMEDAGIHIP